MKQHSVANGYIKTVKNGRFTITFGNLKIGKMNIPFAGASCLHEGEPNLPDVGVDFAAARAYQMAAKEMKRRGNVLSKKAHKRIKKDALDRADKLQRKVNMARELAQQENSELLIVNALEKIKNSDLTTKDLSGMLNISDDSIRRYRSGEQIPRTKTALDILNKFDTINE